MRVVLAGSPLLEPRHNRDVMAVPENGSSMVPVAAAAIVVVALLLLVGVSVAFSGSVQF